MSKLDEFIDNCYHKQDKHLPEDVITAVMQWYMAYQQEPVLYVDLLGSDMARTLWGLTMIGAPDEHMLLDSVDENVTYLKINDNGMSVLREEGLLK